MSEIEIEYDSDLVNRFLEKLDAIQEAKIERLLLRHLELYWDADAETGTVLHAKRTLVSLIPFPPGQYLRVWWRDYHPVCSVLHIGLRDINPDDWDDLV